MYKRGQNWQLFFSRNVPFRSTLLAVTGFKTCSRGFFLLRSPWLAAWCKRQMFLWNFLKELFFSQLKRFLLLPLICSCIPFLKFIMTQRKLAFIWNYWRKWMELRRHIVACIKSTIWEQQEVIFFWSVDATSAAHTLLPMKPNFPLTNQRGIRETSSDLPRHKCFLLERVSVHNKQRKKGKETGREFEKVFSLQCSIQSVVILLLLFLREQDLKVCHLYFFLVLRYNDPNESQSAAAFTERTHLAHCMYLQWEEHLWSTDRREKGAIINQFCAFPCWDMWAFPVYGWAGKSLTGGCFYLSSSPGILLPSLGCSRAVVWGYKPPGLSGYFLMKQSS